MPGPFIFVATNTVREGKLDGERQRAPGWIDFIRSNEPRLIAFHEYLSQDGTEVEFVQVHPDTASFENHMRVVKRSGRAYTETLEGITNIRIYGGPSKAILEMLSQAVGSGVGDELLRGAGLRPGGGRLADPGYVPGTADGTSHAAPLRLRGG